MNTNSNTPQKKRVPVKIKNRFYNSKEDKVFSLKKSIVQYCLNIFSKSHLYSSGNMFSSINVNILEELFPLDRYKAKETFNIDDIVIIPLGHSSLYIVYRGKGILIDPVEGSPSLFFHKYSKQINYNKLPLLHYIIYTHNHPDHYHKKTLEDLVKQYSSIIIIAPLGFKTLLKKEGFTYPPVTELSWHESIVLSKNRNMRLTSVPAKHWSQSNIFNKNKVLWCGWILSCDDINVYISGDTAYGDHFKEIDFFYGPIHIAVVAIAPEQPESIQHESHLSPHDAFTLFLTLNNPLFIPYHWGSFAFGKEPLKEPLEKIMILFLESNNFHLLQGTIINYPFIYKKKKELQKINAHPEDHIISSHFLDHA